MFEGPHGIKYIGVPAWKTKNYYSQTARMEHDQDLEKKLSTDLPVTRESETAAKTGGAA